MPTKKLGCLNLDYKNISLGIMANLASPFISRFPTFPKNALKYQALFHILQVTFQSAEVLLLLNKLHVLRGKWRVLALEVIIVTLLQKPFIVYWSLLSKSKLF